VVSRFFYQTSDHADDDVEDYDLDEIGVGVKLWLSYF